MTSKRPLDQVKRLDYVLRSELAELNDVRYSTVKYYSEMGLIPFEQKGERLAKYYHRVDASKRLKEILKLKGQGKTMTEILAHFRIPVAKRG